MHPPLQILMLSESSYPRHPGGAGKCSHQLAAGLVARGHTVHLVSQSYDAAVREVIDGVEVHRFEHFDTSELAEDKVEATTADYILGYLEREVPLASIDLVHDSGGFLSYFFPVELALKQRWGLPVVLHYQYLMIRHRILETKTGRLDLLGDDFLGFESWLHISSQGFPARFADRVVMLSEDDADFVNEQYRPAGLCEVMPAPVVMHDVSSVDRTARRGDIADDPEAPLVLFGGRIADQLFKGTDIVFKAFERLRAARPSCRLVLAAHDEQTLAPFRQAFGDAAIVLGWIQEARELAEILSVVDVVWMPSRYEPFGLMCAEAMAVGTPVVASPVGGLREMIDDGRTGLLLSQDHPAGWADELADRTADLLATPERRTAIGLRARDFARDHLALQPVARRMENLYREMIEQTTAQPRETIERPEWNDVDTAAYLDRLTTIAGAKARAAGQTVLDGWVQSAPDRCQACTHAYMADSIQALKRLGRARWSRMFGGARWRKRLTRAVADVCPMALRQKELASRKTYMPNEP